jgi:hypothetical protein
MAQLKLAATDAKTIAKRSGIGGDKTRVILFAKNESATENISTANCDVAGSGAAFDILRECVGARAKFPVRAECVVGPEFKNRAHTFPDFRAEAQRAHFWRGQATL